MKLLSFQVKGFRNLTSKVSLSDLGDITVIHGDNNVGKSNLLHAIGVFFGLVGAPLEMSHQNLPTAAHPIALEAVAGNDTARDLFNYAEPVPIEMTAELRVNSGELRRGGLNVAFDEEVLRVGLRIERLGAGLRFWFSELKFRNGGSELQDSPTREHGADMVSLAAFLSKRCGATPATRDVQLDDVVGALYDAHASEDLDHARRWTAFTAAMKSFNDILGEGQFVSVLPRGANQKPQLLFETRKMRIPLRALSSGVQQLVSLLGGLFTSGADIAFLEEPELHLRFTRQEQLREALKRLVGTEGAPSQVILTSHSGAFEASDSFYLVRATDSGPVVEKRPVTDAPAVLGAGARAPLGSAPDVPTFVSSEGVLRLPERIQKAVRIERGGSVSFVDVDDGVVEMMSDATFLNRAGLADDEG